MPPKPTYVQIGLTSELGFLFTWVSYAEHVKMGARLRLANNKSVWTVYWIGADRLEKPPRKGWKAKFLVRKDGTGEPIPSLG